MSMRYDWAAIGTMVRAIKEHPEDGLVYEDSYVKVERVDGKILTTGKPLRSCLIYPEDLDGKKTK